MRALVIDDEQLVLEGMEALLRAAMPDMSLDMTASATTALRMAGSVPYELILLDWHLQDGEGHAIDGREVVVALRQQGCKAPILIVSGDDGVDWHSLIAELDLAGLVPKSASGATLVHAIQVALSGAAYVPRDLSRRRMHPRYRAAPMPPPADPKERFPELTDRQAEVFRLLVRGLSDKQIARELGVSEATVKAHVRAILAVVGVHRRGEAVFEVTGKGPNGANGKR